MSVIFITQVSNVSTFHNWASTRRSRAEGGVSDFRFSFTRKHTSGPKQGRESELEKLRCRPQSVLDGARGGGCTADRGMCRIGRWRGSRSKLSPKGWPGVRSSEISEKDYFCLFTWMRAKRRSLRFNWTDQMNSWWYFWKLMSSSNWPSWMQTSNLTSGWDNPLELFQPTTAQSR